jgi:methyl-accepting chemotaxis protein
MKNKLSVKVKLALIAFVASLPIMLLAAIAFFVLDKLSVGGSLDNDINGSKGLTVQLASPSLYLLETAMQTYELSSMQPRAMLVQSKKIQASIANYREKIDTWADNQFITEAQKTFISVDVKSQALEMLNLIESDIIPAVQTGDIVKITEGSNRVGKYFKEHKGLIGELSDITDERVTDLNKHAKSQISFYVNLLIVISVFAIATAIFSSIYLSLKILNDLGVDVEELKRISNAVASGDVNVILPPIKSASSVLGATALMIDSLKAILSTATENTRIKQALDATSSNVMLADINRNVIYMNKPVEKMLRSVENELRKELPHFSVEKVIDSSIDVFHRDPGYQHNSLANLTSTHVDNIVISGISFRLITNPIFSNDGTRLGSVVEWLNRTQEVAVESEVSEVVHAAGLGNFKARIPTEGKTGFFLNLAEGLNSLMQTSDVGLAEVNRVLGALAKGDLTQRINTEYAGTFGDLKDYCNQTTENLTEMMTEIRTAAETIFSASGEIASGNADLSNRTEQQAANLEETASSMEELTSTVKLNADNAKQANVLAERASAVAIDGGNLIQQVVVTMTSINESSEKIADIIGVIDGIAFQTNILALNAAVEAARAGDQGRGFAVVASEVRTLAQRSANAAKDIKGLISDSVKKIENGNSLVGKSGDTMKEIVTAIKRVNDIMAEIAAASVEQSAGIQEVSSAVSQMDEMTQQNAALVEEAAAAAESLQSQADQLTQRVGEFKLSNNTSRRLPQPTARLAAPSTGAKSGRKSAVKPSGGKKLASLNSQDDEWESF